MGGSAAPNPINYAAIAKSGAQNPGTQNTAGPAPQASPFGSYGPAQMPNYTGAFQNAINAARGNISQQLQTALGDIQNSQKGAEAALGQYAPQVNAAFAATQGTQQNAFNTLSGANKAAGLGSVNFGQIMQPEMAAQGLAHTEQLGNQSLLQQGINEQINREQALAQLGAQSQMGQLDQQQAAFAQQQQQMAQQQAYAQQNALQQFGYQKQLNDQQDQASLRQYQAQQANAQATGPYANSGLTQNQVSSAMANPEYQSIMQRIQAIAAQGPPSTNGKTGNIIQGFADFQAQLQNLQRTNPALYAVLKANAPAGFAPYAKELGLS